MSGAQISNQSQNRVIDIARQLNVELMAQEVINLADKQKRIHELLANLIHEVIKSVPTLSGVVRKFRYGDYEVRVYFINDGNYYRLSIEREVYNIPFTSEAEKRVAWIIYYRSMGEEGEYVEKLSYSFTTINAETLKIIFESLKQILQ